jgi:hypothetical protein
VAAQANTAAKSQTLGAAVAAAENKKPIVSEQLSAAPAAPVNATLFNSTQAAASADNLVQYGYFVGTQRQNSQRSFQRVNENRSVLSAVPASDASGAAAPAPVLTYFRLEQSNTSLRVIDSDNSVYAGQIQSSPALNDSLKQTKASATIRNTLRQNQSPTSSAAGFDQITNIYPGYAFQVMGTNRTSNQRVVFSGLLTGPSNLVDNFTGTGAVGRNQVDQQTRVAASQANRSQTNLQSQDLHVTGTVLLGTDQLEIDAVPAPPPQSAPR